MRAQRAPQIARVLQRLLGGTSGCRMVYAQMFRSNIIGQGLNPDLTSVFITSPGRPFEADDAIRHRK